MLGFVSDLLHAARTLNRARAFTAVCVVSLGLGMGVVMAILLLIRMVFATPPGVKSDRLVELVIRPTGQRLAQAGNDVIDTFSYPDYLDVRDAANGMVLTGWSRGDGLVRPAQQDPAIPVPTMYVSSNYFANLGVALARGAGFTTVNDASRAEREAVIGHRIWQVRFNSDPNIIGRSVTINQAAYTIVGVAPDGFRGHVGGMNDSTYSLWLPLSHHPRLASGAARLERDAGWVRAFARRPDVMAVAQADAVVRSAMATLADRYPSTNREKAGGVEPYFPSGARTRRQVSLARLMALGLSGMVLLVVGLNISGMMVVRSAMRQRELAVRAAMGANRWRLVRYHFSEAFVMAALGGAFASAVLFGGPAFTARLLNIVSPAFDVFKPDPWLVLQCVALCFVTSLVLGVLPAVRFSRPAIVTALKNDSAGSGQRVGRLQRFTAAAQAGLAVPFIVICGVYLDQTRTTAFADVGFAPTGLYATRLNLAAFASSDEQQQLFVRTVQENLAQAPGVRSVTVGNGLPLDFDNRDVRITREGESAFALAHSTRVGSGYLDTLGTRLLAGRSIDADDREGSTPVVVLSAPLARQLFADGEPMGARVSFALAGAPRRIYTVIGISADLVSTQMGNPRPQLFVSLAQHPGTAVVVIARGTPSDPSMRNSFVDAIAGALRRLPGGHTPDDLFRELTTGESLIENSRSDILTMSAAGGIAASVALVLAALGVHGVIAFMVAARTREIGIRVALGASRSRVLRDVLGGALTLVLPGIGVGLVLAVLWVRLTDPSWYPMGGVEPLVYSIAAGIAFFVAVFAGVPSARRAAAVEPMVAMRSE